MTTLNTPRYRPSAFIIGSMVLHVVAAAAVLLPLLWSQRWSAYWPYILATVAVNHAVLTLAGLWPKSQILGGNWMHLPPAGNNCPMLAAPNQAVVAITIDDGPDPAVTPRVLAILKAHKVQATFFCIAQRVAQYPELARSIVEHGHAIENHSERHAHTFSLWGPGKLRADIARAQTIIECAVGRRPQFFRAPAGLRNPFLDYALQKNQVHLAAWTRRGFDTRTGDADVVFKRLTQGLSGGDILLLHDSHCALTAQGEPVIVDVLPRLLTHIQDLGLRCVRLDQAAP
jgi:peptidoglycan/xylan/chitin deacetylase (PgdA/CDA1 family)